MSLTIRRTVGSLAMLLLSSWAAGCNSEPPPEVGKVVGKVTYAGQPVTEGMVTFSDPASGNQAQTLLAPDGTYVIDAAVVGDYTVIITPKPFEGGMTADGKAKQPPPPPKNIPSKFQRPDSSGLKTTIVPGDNEFNIEMKD